MTHDPDLIQIQRKRRQQKRCLSCGTPTPRASLCKACRATWCYCPRCEAVYPATEASPRSRKDGRCAIYCQPCNTAMRRAHGGRQVWADYLRERRATAHPHMQTIVRLYRAGCTYTAIAQAIGLSKGGLASLITRARHDGRWPKTLRRVAK